MKTKLYKVFGVALALVLVFSLFAGFMPANKAEAQAYTPNQWNAMAIPSAGGLGLVAGSRIVDFAVAPDGTTIYLADNAAGAWGVAKSTDGGRSFSWLFNVAVGPPVPAGPPPFAAAPTAIAVAPDNPDCAAVVEGGGGGLDRVWITTDGGATWATMGVPGVVGTERISDIAVSPARTGTILGRDYAVSTYDTIPIAGALGFGDIYICGTTANWAAVATTVVPAVNLDWTSLALAPNWTGDRVVVGIGSDNLAAGNPEVGAATVGDTYLVPINVATIVPTVPAPGAVLLDAAASDSPSEIRAVAATPLVVTNGETWASDIALPADFDSTSVGGFRAFVSWTSTRLGGVILCADDVYRVDFNSVRKLEIRASVAIYSISYFGTIGAGTLMAGTQAAVDGGVWFTSEPTSGSPNWGAGSGKPPTGLNNYIVALTSNNEAFAAATGGNGAFSKTLDGGLSFNGLSFIDEAIVVINDVMPSPDGSVIFMATEDAVGGNHSLWRGLGFPNPGSWERVHFQLAAQFLTAGSLVRLSPDYGTDTTLYWFDATGTRIQRSTDAGQMWGTRTGTLSVDDAAVESASVLYTINAAGGTVYASTNGGWFFGLPINPGIGALNSIAMAPSYPNAPVAGNVLVGAAAAGTPGGVCLSTNAAATWAPLLSFAAGAANMQVYGDAGYAENNTVYAGAGTGIWRYNVGSSSAWEQIRISAAVTGLSQHGGVLFASWAGVAAGAVGADTFTLKGGAGADIGTIAVTVGSLTATATGTATVGGVGAGIPVPITLGMGAIPYTLPLLADTILITCTTAGTSGVWTSTTVNSTTILVSAGTVVGAGGAAGAYVFTMANAAAGAGAAASGAERTLGPTIPDYAAAFWDTMNVGSAAATFNAAPSALRVAGTDTTTSAWIIDTAGVALFAYNDEMALAKSELTVPDTVPFDSVTGGSAEFVISWTNISNALMWELEICTDPGMAQRVVTTGAAYMPPFPPGPTFVVPVNSLVAGKDYFTHVRARDEMPGDAIRSQWSSVQRFTVQAGERVEVSYLGVQPLGPQPGATDVPLSPGFTWSPYASSTRYEFQLATDAGFADILAEAKVAATGYKYDGTLANATTYFWRARGIEPTITGWSPVASFTTEKVPVPPVVIEPTPIPPTPAPLVTPAIIWAIIAIGAILVIAVIVLIVKTRAAPH